MTQAAVALRDAIQTLTAAGIADAPRDARKLLAYVLEQPLSRMTLFLHDPLTSDHLAAFQALIARRARFEPVSHLVGERMFFGRAFRVTPAVLDPRPETETLIEIACEQSFDTLLDLGTGSGCILLTLLAERPDTHGIGVDLSAAALEVAHWNAQALSLVDRTRLAQGSWFDALDAEEERVKFDLIVSNPPYIAKSEMAGLAPDVRLYEPHMALTDEGDGLSCYRAIACRAAKFLAPQGRILVEIGARQGRDVTAIFAQAGFEAPRVIQDLDGRDRVIAATLPANTR